VVNSEGIGPLTGIVDISAGGNFSLAVNSDGFALAWGNNESYQLGDLTNYDRKTPLIVQRPEGDPLTDIVDISAGGGHAVARKSDGSVYVWGFNKWTEENPPRLGVDTEDLYVIGTYQVPGVSNVVKISTAGDDPSILALKSDGTALAWGNNFDGQLCQETSEDVIENPATVKGPGGEGNLTNITQISATLFYSLFLRSDGTVWGCGYNGYSSLAQGTWEDYYLFPVQAKSPDEQGYLTNVANISKETLAGNSFAITSGNSVFAWGDNSLGQLGIGIYGINKNLPTPLLFAGYAIYSGNLNGEPLTGVSVGSENSENLSFLVSPDGGN
jgi:alpha-tubulin suppressor-like RCC1 family protein